MNRARAFGVLALALVALAVVAIVPRRDRAPALPVPPSARPGVDAASAKSPAPAAPPAPSAVPELPDYDPDAVSIPEQRRELLVRLARSLSLSEDALERVRAVVDASDWMSQGNPKITKRAMTRTECRERRRAAPRLPEPDPRCGAPHMVPLGRGASGDAGSPAFVCIDQYEFPNIPCEYPLVWVRANEASALCRAVGKRLCDAHEWEGGCAGKLLPADEEYAWGERRVMMEHLHNEKREVVWAYGREQNHALCATGSKKSPKCLAGGFTLCGTNDYPSGSFPECASPLGVFDQHGNVAEHMNLPMKPEELGARGGTGQTEMKGSWFIFAQAPAHADDCRFRAPGWHASRVDDSNSHRNYHLGFRCCRDAAPW